MKLRQKDMEIISHLRKGESVGAISKKMKLPKSTVYYHMTKLKTAGLIKGMKISLDYEQSSEYQAAVVLVSLSSTNIKDSETFINKLKTEKVVTEILAVTGDWDFAIIIHGKKEDLTEFIRHRLQAMPNITKTHSLFVIQHIEV